MEDRDQILTDLGELLVKTMKDLIRIAGHVMTGELVGSVEYQISKTATKARIDILLNSYGIALDQGVPADRIPYTPTPPYRGGKSLYIEGLARFARIKLGKNDPKEALAVAFAIANKHKKTGMPVNGPTEFIQRTIDATEAEIEQAAADYAETVFEVIIGQAIESIAA